MTSRLLEGGGKALKRFGFLFLDQVSSIFSNWLFLSYLPYIVIYIYMTIIVLYVLYYVLYNTYSKDQGGATINFFFFWPGQTSFLRALRLGRGGFFAIFQMPTRKGGGFDRTRNVFAFPPHIHVCSLHTLPLCCQHSTHKFFLFYPFFTQHHPPQSLGWYFLLDDLTPISHSPSEPELALIDRYGGEGGGGSSDLPQMEGEVWGKEINVLLATGEKKN